MVPISFLPSYIPHWLSHPNLSLKPLLMKHTHTTSFQDWPCNQCKFYKLQGTLGNGKLMSLPQLFLISQKRRLPLPRALSINSLLTSLQTFSTPLTPREEGSSEPVHGRPCKATEDTEAKHATSWMKHYPDFKLVWHFHSKSFWGTWLSNTEHFSFGLFLEGPIK